MSNLSEQLLELHLQHELQRLSDEQIAKNLKEEIDAFFEFSNEIKLKELISEKALGELRSPHITPSEKIYESLGRIILAIYGHKIHEKTSPGDLIQKEHLENFFDQELGFDTLRHEILDGLLKSSMAQDIITDMLYSGISRYVEQSNEIAKKVPGAKAMIKVGKGFAKRAAPALEDQVEFRVKKTIQLILPEVIAQSEKMISGSINDEAISEFMLKMWDKLEGEPIAGAREYLTEEEISSYYEGVSGKIQSLRQDPENTQAMEDYIHVLYQAGLKSFYKDYGNKKLRVLLGDVGVDASLISELITPISGEVIENLKASGYLEARLRARLSNFYQGEAAQALLK